MTEVAPEAFDVFLSYNGRDRALVGTIAERLRLAGLNPWFDQWHLAGGESYQEAMHAGLLASSACAYFAGAHGEGNWTREELGVARSRAVEQPRFRLVPVLLPGLAEPFDRTSLPPFLAQRTWVDYRSGIESRDALQALINAIKGVPSGGPAAARDDDQPPYRGLLPFSEDDSELFFGREADVQRLVEKLRGSRFLAVLGPSGSGKSSLVRAGLVPALRYGELPGSENWPIRVMRPGARPLDALSGALAPLLSMPAGALRDELASDERTLHLSTETLLGDSGSQSRVCWVIDQAEELFTLCHDDAERALFVAALGYAAAIPGGRTTVIITMRADFYPRLAPYPQLAALVGDSQYLVSPLGEAGLREAIEKPALRSGLAIEEGLVETILRDVEDRPGRLPLLQHALLEVWHRRRGSMLTLEGYREAGGVEGALAKRAEATFESFTTEEQQLVRRALLRLTEPGEGTEDTRRRATFSELVGTPIDAQRIELVVNRLADDRLVTVSRAGDSGDSWVDISHEALIRGWPRMRAWIDDDREALRVQRRIAEAAAEWERFARDDDGLLRGARLAEAIEFADANRADMNVLERTYIDASIGRQSSERKSRERFRRRLTAAGFGLAIVSLLAAVGAGLLWIRAENERAVSDALRVLAEDRTEEADRERQEADVQALEAERQKQEANRQRELSFSRQLAALASATLGDLDLSLLLSVEALRTADTYEARSSLLAALTSQNHVLTFLNDGRPARVLAYSPDGSLLVSGGDAGTVNVWSVDTRRQITSFITGPGFGDAVDNRVLSLAFTPDGSLLAAGDDVGVTLWNAATWERVGMLPVDGQVRDLRFTADGRSIVAADDAKVTIWDLAGQNQVGEPFSYLQFMSTYALSPDGATVAVVNGTIPGIPEPGAPPEPEPPSIALYDVATGLPLGDPIVVDNPVTSIAFDNDGERLGVTSVDSMTIWSVASQAQVAALPDSVEGDRLVFSPDGHHVAFETLNQIILWDLENQAQIAAFDIGDDQILAMMFSLHGETFATGGLDGRLAIWRVADPNRIRRALYSSDVPPSAMAIGMDGRRLAVASVDGVINYWDVPGGQEPAGMVQGSADSYVELLAWSPDGQLLAAAYPGGPIDVWNLEQSVRLEIESRDGERFTELAFASGGRILASTHWEADGVFLWDAATGEPFATLPAESASQIAFSPDGHLIAAMGGESILLYDVETREQLASIPTNGYPTAITFSRDGRLLASANGDGKVVIWDVATRAQVGVQMTEPSAATALAFSPDNKLLASAGEFLRLWDLERRQPIGPPLAYLGQHGSLSPDLTFNADGSRLVSASDIAFEWNVHLESWTHVACEVANRNLTVEEWQRYMGDVEYRPTCPAL